MPRGKARLAFLPCNISNLYAGNPYQRRCTIPGKNILLVEDNPDDEFLTLRILRKLVGGATIEVTRDGVATLDYLFGRQDGAPSVPLQLILLDLQLPKVGGLEVLQQIAAHEATREIPVIVLSSSDSPHEIDRCRELGAFCYLCKPLSLDRLRNCLAQLNLE